MKIINPFDVQSGGVGGVIAGLILAAAFIQSDYQYYFVLCWIVAVVLSNWPKVKDD